MRAPLFALALSACHAVIGEYGVDATEGCDSDADCDTDINAGCDRGRCAIRCLDDGPCPPFSECWAARFCTEPIGTPCEASDDDEFCGGYPCRFTDADAKPVAGYCPGYCHPQMKPCPDGFSCVNLSCYRTAPE